MQNRMFICCLETAACSGYTPVLGIDIFLPTALECPALQHCNGSAMLCRDPGAVGSVGMAERAEPWPLWCKQYNTLQFFLLRGIRRISRRCGRCEHPSVRHCQCASSANLLLIQRLWSTTLGLTWNIQVGHNFSCCVGLFQQS